MRISDWSSDVCSSDLRPGCAEVFAALQAGGGIFVPWLHAGRLAAALYVLTAEPRRWSYSDLLTLQEALKPAHDVTVLLPNEPRQILLIRAIHQPPPKAQRGRTSGRERVGACVVIPGCAA